MKEHEAELIGAHIGDGTLYQTKTSIVWELRGSLHEQSYYDKHVVKLLRDIFNIEFKAKFRSGGANGCYGVQTSKKEVSKFFLRNSCKVGSKLYTANIPEPVFTANKKCKEAFLRGLFDTDGCIRFDRINRQALHTYPRIEFTFASKQLRDDLKILLQKLKFRCYVWDLKKKEYHLCISGKEQARRWFLEIAPANKKHLNRYRFWIVHGYFVPRSHSLAIAVIR